MQSVELSGHWLSYLKGAFALSNAFGARWEYGQEHAADLASSEIVGRAELALHEATVGNPELTELDAQALAVLGARLWEIFADASRGGLEIAADSLNTLLEQVAPRPGLIRHGPAGNWHLHFTAASSSEGARWASDLTVGAAMLIGSEDFDRIGLCAADRCDRVFLDSTKNQTQSYCSGRCQDRVKSAALRERRKSARALEPTPTK